MKRFVSLSDVHAPWEDVEAITLVHQFLSDFRPHYLVFNGDIFDCPSISKYSPRRAETMKQPSFQEQLDHGRDVIESLVEAARPEVTHLLLGNHEDRIEQYLGVHPELGSLRVLDSRQLFAAGGALVREYGDGLWLNESLYVYHGTFHGTTAVRRERERIGASTITGHGHTQKVEYHNDLQRGFKSMMQGCLCQLKPPYARVKPSWQSGFVYGYIIDEDKFRACEVEIVHGSDATWMMPDGQYYEVTE